MADKCLQRNQNAYFNVYLFIIRIDLQEIVFIKTRKFRAKSFFQIHRPLSRSIGQSSVHSFFYHSDLSSSFLIMPTKAKHQIDLANKISIKNVKNQRKK